MGGEQAEGPQVWQGAAAVYCAPAMALFAQLRKCAPPELCIAEKEVSPQPP
jgi:hypothetical protein